MEVVDKEWMVFRMPSPEQDGVCAVEILRLDDGRHAVIVEELDDNPGQSVSGGWDYVVKAIHEKYPVPVADTVWIEHESEPDNYGAKLIGIWQLVTFSPARPGELHGKANWRAMTTDDWHELGLTPRE
jgi:hypothetical protein